MGLWSVQVRVTWAATPARAGTRVAARPVGAAGGVITAAALPPGESAPESGPPTTAVRVTVCGLPGCGSLCLISRMAL